MPRGDRGTTRTVTDPGQPGQEALREGLKTVAVALKETGLPFALVGGYAAWVHGAPEPGHDVDFLVSPGDAPAAAEQLSRGGLLVRQPPEDWLFKVEAEGATIDVIHRTTSAPVEEVLGRVSTRPVLSVRMPVISPTDLVSEKLLSLAEHYCNITDVLPPLRALREQVAWDEVVRRTDGHPFAEAVLFLLDRLGVVGLGIASGMGRGPGGPQAPLP